MPAHPRTGSTATLELNGSTARTAMPLVLTATGSACPAPVPQPAHVVVPRTGVVTGGVVGSVRVRIDAATTRICVFLVPATQDAYGTTRYVKTAAPLATAEVAVGGAPRLEGGGVLFGATRTGDSTVGLLITRSGTRVTKITVTCGGNPLHPPALGKLFIGKRFAANVSLPLTSTIRWSGRLLPDNSANYDVPPARWDGPVHYTLHAQLVVDPVDGQPQKLVGTGTLTGPRLPCPKQRRYTRS